MKLWDKGIATAHKVHEFTSGNDRVLDSELAVYDVKGSIAHVKMLHHVGVLEESEQEQLVKELNVLLHQFETEGVEIPAQFEDIHSYVEYLLTQKLGDTGKKVHTGRSRNDQVLVDLHLYSKDQLSSLKNHVKSLIDQLLTLSEQHKEAIIPGYTHMQVAMPSSIGLWLGGHAEMLVDDLIWINAAYQIADQNPLGSAAGYGSGFPLNRQMTTQLLDFKAMKVNATAAQMSRGKLEKACAIAVSSVASSLSKLAMDTCLFMSQNLGFISFPDELTTGSSIMPHKKNPDVMELVRGKCNLLQSLPQEITLLINNLPSGYHRDFQELKGKHIWSFKEIGQCLEMVQLMFSHLIVKQGVIEQSIYDYVFSVENLNQLVLEGLSFREAYQTVGAQIEAGNYVPNKQLNHQHVGSVGNLGNDLIKEKMQELNKMI